VIEMLASQGQHGWGGGWGGGPWIGLVWVAFWAVVILGGIYLFRRRSQDGRTDPGAEAVLAARYARGDITEEEYRERLVVLRETKA
jgi:putative membrane protein